MAIMAVGEVFLSAFLEVLFDRLVPRELFHFTRQDVLLELNKWRRTLLMIQAVVNDAEEKQLTDRAVKMWLADLQDLAYDVEDILDEFATEALKQKLMAEHDHITNVSTADYFTSSNLVAMFFNDSMESKVKDITIRLEELYEQRLELGLEKVAGGASSFLWQRPPSTCLPTEPEVYGRNEDKVKILDMILRNEKSDVNFDIVSIVGMGGIGKTTLARLVYNDDAVKDFQPKAWVCVSNDFDILRITKAILESITLSSCDLKDLNQVQIQLKEAILQKKFLLVLDDVWSKNYDLWQILKSPFMAGAPGSKIIVTTRNVEVALIMGPMQYYNLKLLSDDDCWSLFKKHAFRFRDAEKHRDSEILHEKVVEKCKGLPLAARALGGLLRSKQRIDEWDDIFNNNVWELSDESEILKSSYHDLPSHLKRCFTYCAIFPKDYEFEEKEMVLLWMAEGLIQPSDSIKQPEDLGGEYFRDLLSRTIFQRSSSNSSKFVMHNLMNDLAQRIPGETSFRLEDELKANKQSRRFQKVRHSSYSRGYYDGKSKFEVFQGLECLRTFMPVSLEDDEPHYITNMVISDLLPKLQKLRVLSFKGYHITELPHSIGGLKHLRYLNLSKTKIKNLPKSTSSLCNLQSLILKDCFCLRKLPSNFETLVNLRHLDIRGANLIREMPSGMKELKFLQTLSNFIIGKDNGSGLKSLKNLKLLRGKLCISGLSNIISSYNMGEAILDDMKDIEVLFLEWASQLDDSQDEVVEKNVLDVLQPHKNIKELAIKNYGGTSFPSWLENPSFSNMVVVQLEECKKCTYLPSFGLLGSLKDLTIKGMKDLKTIGSEIYGNYRLKPFQSLETLCFWDLQEWEQWHPLNGNENEHVERFPCLQKLSIVRCPKLLGSLPEYLPSLEELTVCECAQLKVSFSSYPMLCKLEIDGCKGLLCRSPSNFKSLNSMTLSNISEFENWLRQGFQKLERLMLANCEELISLWQNKVCLERPPQGLQLHSLKTLKQLRIENCANLISFPDAWVFSILSGLEIVDCKALMSLPEGLMQNSAHLTSMHIEGCESLTFIAKGQLPSSLKRLYIIKCEKLECLLDNADGNHISSSSTCIVMHNTNICTSLLEYLHISDCPSLICLSAGGGLPEALKSLKIWRCSELRTLSLTGQLPSSLTWLEICDCSKLESVAENFHGNTSLGYFLVEDCENLKSIPQGLHILKHFRQIRIWACPSLVSLPEEGLPKTLTNLSASFQRREKLEALPNHMHSLNSLQALEICQCPSIVSFPEDGLPTHITSLAIEDLTFYEPLVRWGIHKLTSLRRLQICGCPDAVSFPFEEMEMMLPTSLTKLTIGRFGELKYLSSKGFKNLTSLEYLGIDECPKLTGFPEEGLPSSLLQLYINECPLLKKQCKKDKGQEWPKIANIPCVEIDGRFIYDPEEEELAELEHDDKKEGGIRESFIQSLKILKRLKMNSKTQP